MTPTGVVALQHVTVQVLPMVKQVRQPDSDVAEFETRNNTT